MLPAFGFRVQEPKTDPAACHVAPGSAQQCHPAGDDITPGGAATTLRTDRLALREADHRLRRRLEDQGRGPAEA